MSQGSAQTLKTWPGNDKGFYDIGADFSLLIREVTVEMEGKYFCERMDLRGAPNDYSGVIVNVFGKN